MGDDGELEMDEKLNVADWPPPPAYGDPHEKIIVGHHSQLRRVEEELKPHSGRSVEHGNVMRIQMGRVFMKGRGVESIHTEYSILVQTNIVEYLNAGGAIYNGLWVWNLKFRFSEFLKFHEELAQSGLCRSPLPPAPPKARLGRFTDDIVFGRRRQMAAVLQWIAEDEQLCRCGLVVEFLWPAGELELSELVRDLVPLSDEEIRVQYDGDFQRNSLHAGAKLLCEPIPIVRTGIDAFLEYSDSGNATSTFAVETAAVGGRAILGSTGALVGTALAPGVGTFVLGMAGSFVGALSGRMAARRAIATEKLVIGPDEGERDRRPDPGTQAADARRS